MGSHPGNHWHQPDETRLAQLAGAYADALVAGDEIAAEIAVREAMDAELGTVEIDEKIIAPALWLIGELWERGTITIAEEHIATEITIRVLALQREAQRVKRGRGRYRVMLATPPGEAHVVALRMVENLVRESGYDVVMLGADVPAPAIATAAQLHEVDVLCLSATMPGRREAILTVIDEVRDARPSVPVLLGGRGLTVEDQMRAEVQVSLGVTDAMEAIDGLIQRAGLN